MKTYKEFFWKFWKAGYISEPQKLNSGQKVFFYDLNSCEETKNAIAFLEGKGMEVVKSSLQPDFSGMVIMK